MRSALILAIAVLISSSPAGAEAYREILPFPRLKLPPPGGLTGDDVIDHNDVYLQPKKEPCQAGYKPVAMRRYIRWGSSGIKSEIGAACIRASLNDCPAGKLFEYRAVPTGKTEPRYAIYFVCSVNRSSS
ncbi:MAG: hypothetical protein AB203_00145 [Parcubacteria bacterium C7867-008]|nr:MAG: hypothetical protein AB203_00145 [Parcubacteria bacterium C7867-008]